MISCVHHLCLHMCYLWAQRSFVSGRVGLHEFALLDLMQCCLR